MANAYSVDLVQRWQDAVNRQDVPSVLTLSDTHIEIVGPRGTAYGHEVLSDWVQRAGARFVTSRIFARDDRVVVAQHGEWRSLETGTVIGEAEVATSFRIAKQHVVRVARFDSLEQALDDAELTIADKYRAE